MKPQPSSLAAQIANSSHIDEMSGQEQFLEKNPWARSHHAIQRIVLDDGTTSQRMVTPGAQRASSDLFRAPDSSVANAEFASESAGPSHKRAQDPISSPGRGIAREATPLQGPGRMAGKGSQQQGQSQSLVGLNRVNFPQNRAYSPIRGMQLSKTQDQQHRARAGPKFGSEPRAGPAIRNGHEKMAGQEGKLRASGTPVGASR